jgi:glutamine---fructose-6-phosphate transaminase (isomerizing)
MNLLDEILDQPRALRGLMKYYGDSDHAFPAAPGSTLITGMGASYQAAAISGLHLQTFGLSAQVLEATDLIHYSSEILSKSDLLVYVSQSGSSGEVPIILGQIPSSLKLIAVTNEPQSPLGLGADFVMPILAGDEELIASKSFTNSLIVMWLLVRRWAGVLQIGDFTVLNMLANRMELLIQHRQRTIDQWLQTFEKADQLIFLGHGPHAFTARQAAMITAEWTKRPALYASVGAFRHGPIEIIQPGSVVVLFSSPRVRTSTLALAEELTAHGAACLYVENGRIGFPNENQSGVSSVDDFLAPILDTLLVQFFISAMAELSPNAQGFRYIEKVVKNI